MAHKFSSVAGVTGKRIEIHKKSKKSRKWNWEKL